MLFREKSDLKSISFPNGLVLARAPRYRLNTVPHGVSSSTCAKSFQVRVGANTLVFP